MAEKKESPTRMFGDIEVNVKEILDSKMSKEDFVKIHKHLFPTSVEKIYDEIVGKK